MKRALLTIALGLLCAGLARAETDLARLADALAHKETGLGWSGRPGRVGELSRYQLTRICWAQHSREPFDIAARDEAKARAVALAHLAWLRSQLAARGIAATPERLATVWHSGLRHARRSSEWGQQVANLYGVTP